MTAIALTAEQQIAVNRFEDNVNETGCYGIDTLTSILRSNLNGGGWQDFLAQLALVDQKIYAHVELFFLAVCGYTPKTIWQESGSDKAAVKYIAKQIDSDDAVPFRETSRYLNDFLALSASEQQEVDGLLRVVFPNVPLLDTIQKTLLPAIETLHKKRGEIPFYITLTAEQQIAVNRFEDNVDETGCYGTDTLTSILRSNLNGGDWQDFLAQLAQADQKINAHVDLFFLAVCGYAPKTIWLESGSGEAAVEYIAEQIDSDDAVPFRETSRYLNDFLALSASEQQEVDSLLRVVFPNVPLLDTIQKTLLPAIETLHKKRGEFPFY